MGTGFIEWIQQLSTPELDIFFKTITRLGNAEYYFVVLPLLYWLYNEKLAMRFMTFFALSIYFNSAVKYNFAMERPDPVLHRIEETGYSFPSAHAQGSMSFWGFLALELRKIWLYLLAGLLIILISLSRIYLGVHYGVDIVGGLFLGVAFLALYVLLIKSLRLKLQGPLWYMVTGGGILLLFFNHSMGEAPLTLGFLLGILWGHRWQKQWLQWNIKGDMWHHLVRGLLGVVVIFLLRFLLRELFGLFLSGEETLGWSLLTFLRYCIIGFWVTLGAPYVFLRAGLYPREETEEKAQGEELGSDVEEWDDKAWQQD